MLLEVVLGPIEYIELSLWIVSMVALGIVGVLYLNDYKKTKQFFCVWVSLFFFLFILGRYFRILVRFYIGEPPIGGTFEGEALTYEILYTLVTYTGLFFLYFAIERKLIPQTRYTFSILTWISCILTIIDFTTRTIYFITIPIFLVVLLIMPSIFVYISTKTNGKSRQNALLIVIAILLFELGIVMDIPEGRIVFGGLPAVFLAIVPPSLTIISCFFLRGLNRVENK